MTLAAPLLLFFAALAQDSETDRLKKDTDKLRADNDELRRQIDTYANQMKEMAEKLEKLKLSKPGEEQVRQAALAALAEMNSAKKAQEYTLTPGKVYAPAAPPPGVVRPEPKLSRTSIEGKVTAIAHEIGLVFLSVGSDDGVKEGDEFTIHREGTFIARIRIDRDDRKGCAGKILLKTGDGPRVGDLASNHILVSSPRLGGRVPEPAPATALAPGPADELKALRKELDDVRSQVRQLSDHLVPSWQDAGVSVEEASEDLRSQLGIPKGLVIRRVREGSAAEKAGLRTSDVVPNLAESQLLDMIAKRLPLTFIRKGQQIVLPPK
jgi:hypothetical protein